jgi:hypothetical protein
MPTKPGKPRSWRQKVLQARLLSRLPWTKKNPLSEGLITDFRDSYVGESRPLPSLQPAAAYNNAYYAYDVNYNTGNGLKFHQKAPDSNYL